MNSESGKIRVLFLCTGNSCRSQMAEAWVNALKPDTIEAFSAGVEIHGLNPDAVAVMAEAGIDMTRHRSKHVDEFRETPLDVVVTVCNHAKESCPYFPAKCRKIHAGFDDPPQMAKEAAEKGGGRQAQLDCYRKVRDEIRAFVEQMPEIVFDSSDTR